MFNMVVQVTRFGVVVFWTAAVLSVATIVPLPYATYIMWAAGAIFVFHFLEYVFVKTSIAPPDGEEISFIKTILFGFSYLLPIFTKPKQDQ